MGRFYLLLLLFWLTGEAVVVSGYSITASFNGIPVPSVLCGTDWSLPSLRLTILAGLYELLT